MVPANESHALPAYDIAGARDEDSVTCRDASRVQRPERARVHEDG